MLTELLTALALVLVIEGLMPFVSPGGFRSMMARMLALADRQLRLAGLASMAAGVIVLYLVR